MKGDEPAAQSARFQPVSDEHAVEMMAFSVVANRFIDTDDIRELANRHNAIRAELPALNLLDEPTPTIEFGYRRPDGSSTWVLRCGRNSQITVECYRYTRWQRVWPIAQKLLLHAMKCCASVDKISFGLPTLRVVDRFRALDDDIQLSDLLRRDPFIAEAAFDRGPVFHSNVGWFDTVEDASVLSTLNVHGRRDSFFDPTAEQTREDLYILIDHDQQLRSDRTFNASEAKEDNSVFQMAMSHLHDRNKNLLMRIMVDSMQERIGLRKLP